MELLENINGLPVIGIGKREYVFVMHGKLGDAACKSILLNTLYSLPVKFLAKHIVSKDQREIETILFDLMENISNDLYNRIIKIMLNDNLHNCIENAIDEFGHDNIIGNGEICLDYCQMGNENYLYYKDDQAFINDLCETMNIDESYRDQWYFYQQ